MILLYEFIPLFSFVLLSLSFFYKIHKRSVSAFLNIAMVAISSNLIYLQYYESSMIVIIFFTITIFTRAIVKPKNDKWIVRVYQGEEKRNTRNRINAES